MKLVKLHTPPLVLCVVIVSLLVKVGSSVQQSERELIQDPNCGLVSVIPGDPRTEAPWSASIFVRSGSKKNYNFYTTGVLISPALVLSVVGGKLGANITRQGVISKYALPEPSNIVIGAGLRTTNLKQRDRNSQFMQVSHIVPFSGHEATNREFHFLLYHLKRPLNMNTPYVRSACILSPNSGRNAVMLQSGYLFPVNNKDPLSFRTISVTSVNQNECDSVFRQYYRSSGAHVFCGRASEAELPESSNSCLRHGSPVVFPAVQNRWFLAGLTALIPSRKQGRCNRDSLYIYARTAIAVNWMTQNIKCSKSGNYCNPSCVPWKNEKSKNCIEKPDEDVNLMQQTAGLSSIIESEVSSATGRITTSGPRRKIIFATSNNSPTPTPDLSVATERIGSACFPLPLSGGVKAECVDLESGNDINCTKAEPNTLATLSCDQFYTSKYRFHFIEMKCGQDGRWTPYRPFACEPECGILSSGFQPLLTNGKITNKNNAFPWHAGIFRFANGRYNYICGASLIEKCVNQIFENPTAVELYRVVLAPASSSYDVNLDDEIAQVFSVSQVHVPHTYNKRTLKSDIAVIKLEKAVTFGGYIRPICYLLPYYTQIPTVGSLGKVAGFGIDETGEISESLKYADLPVVSEDKCKKSIAGLPVQSSFCAGYGNGTITLCRGDSGGGIAFPEIRRGSGVQRYTIKGIVSSGQLSNSNGCDVENYAAFTHVDWFGDWIIDILEKS